MLSQEITHALRQYAAAIQRPVRFVLQSGKHRKRDELVQFLSDVAAVSEHIEFEQRETNGLLRSPISFLIEADGHDTGIRFSGIPGGHEFNSLVLALLQAGGTEIRLDSGLKRQIAAVSGELHFEVFVSLSCHNCPDVVQALNQFALLNRSISAEMIDGGLFPELISEREIQGVPAVFLNGEPFANGKTDASGLIETLLAHSGETAGVGGGNRDSEGHRKVDTANRAQGDTPSLPLQDVTIIGGGPAGVSAAIYSARKGLAVTLVAERFGGQVKDTLGIENLISVPKTTGPELVGALMDHLSQHPVTLKEHLRVTRIEPGDIKTIELSSGEKIRTRALIIATGARWRELGVPGEKENIGNGVAYCPHCDGPFFKGKDVAVVGGGNSGIEAALDLAGIVRSVTVLEFAPKLKADQVLLDQARARDNITILTHVATQRITASGGKVDGIEYQDRQTNELHRRALSGVFVQIGLVPNSQFVEGIVERNDYGEIVVDPKCLTSEPGIFACGDVTNVPYKQIIVASGEGSKAALAAFEYLLAHALGTDKLDRAA